MAITKKQFIQHYAKQACNGDTSLFLGAGISASAGYPSWKDLLQPCAKELGLQIDDSIDLYLLAQYYSNQFGYSALKRIINDNVNRLMYESNLVDELLNLNFKSIWTTNYDTVLEKNFFKRNILTNTVYNDKDLSNITQNDRVNIYKLNGDIANLDKIVITQNDIESYGPNHELLLTFFKRELVVRTFLFLGYSFADSIVLSCLSTVNRCLEDSANHHYAIMKKHDSSNFGYFVNDLGKRYHINILLIDDYDELPQVLNELNHEIKRKNLFFSGVFDRLPYEQDIFANSLCRKLTEKLIERDYTIYTGYGRNFGNYLAGYSLQYLLLNNKSINKYLVMRPFLKTMSAQEQSAHREMLINDCHIALFMFGQIPAGNDYANSKGMWDEYEIAKNKNKIIIPVGCTGYTAKEIWADIKQNITLYPYLEKYIYELNKLNTDKVVDVILQILNEVC
jgi:hypothetical protein